MKTYYYETVSRYLYILGKSRLGFIVGLHGAMGGKEYYTKESVQVLVNSKAE